MITEEMAEDELTSSPVPEGSYKDSEDMGASPALSAEGSDDPAGVAGRLRVEVDVESPAMASFEIDVRQEEKRQAFARLNALLRKRDWR